MLNRVGSTVHSSFGPRAAMAIPKSFPGEDYEDLERVGIDIRKAVAAMDAIQPSVTTGTIGTPVQFLQYFVPGWVNVLTAKRKIDELTGRATIGNWYDAQIIWGLMDRLGNVQPYGDYTNIPLSSWQLNFNYRSVVVFEQGMMVGNKEAATAAAMKVNAADMKRQAVSLVLENNRNAIGFYGYNSGNNNTYGFLNEPNLSAYGTVANGASGSPLWSRKTTLEIEADLLAALVAIRTNSADTIDPKTARITLAVPTDAVDYLSTATQFNISVMSWLAANYPNVRVVSAPQLNNANGGANVFYMYAEKVEDDSTDDGDVWLQAVPATFLVNGVQQQAKGYLEDYISATAGQILKRPFAVVRYSGI